MALPNMGGCFGSAALDILGLCCTPFLPSMNKGDTMCACFWLPGQGKALATQLGKEERVYQVATAQAVSVAAGKRVACPVDKH